MRIIYIVPHPNSRAKSIGKYLTRIGHDVTLISTTFCWGPYDKLLSESKSFLGPQEFENIVDVHPPLFLRHQILRLAISLPRIVWVTLRETLRRQGDILLAYNPTVYTALPALCVARLLGKPLVIDYVEKVHYSETRVSLVGLVERLSLRLAHSIIVLTNCFRDFLTSRWHIDVQKIYTLPLGIDAQLVDRSRIDVEKYRKLYHCQDGPVVVYAGFRYLVNENGKSVDLLDVERLIRAAPIVLAAMPTTKFIFLGPSVTEQWNRLIAELGIETHVLFLPGIYTLWGEQHLSTMALGDCLCLTTSKYLAASLFSHNKGNDYLLLGRPIVAAGAPGPTEMLRDAAFFYEPENEKDLAAKIIYCIQHKQEAWLMAERGLKYATKEYSWEVLSYKLDAILRHAHEREEQSA